MIQCVKDIIGGQNMKYLILLLFLVSCGSDLTDTMSSAPGSSVTLDSNTTYQSTKVFNLCATYLVPEWTNGGDDYELMIRCKQGKENAVRDLMINGDSQVAANDKVYKEVFRMNFEGYDKEMLIEYNQYRGLYYWEM